MLVRSPGCTLCGPPSLWATAESEQKDCLAFTESHRSHAHGRVHVGALRKGAFQGLRSRSLPRSCVVPAWSIWTVNSAGEEQSVASGV